LPKNNIDFLAKALLPQALRCSSLTYLNKYARSSRLALGQNTLCQKVNIILRQPLKLTGKGEKGG